MNISIPNNKFFVIVFTLLCCGQLLSSPLVFAQTTLPLTYSPDGAINSIIAKGDTLIVGGDFKHVGKYTGGGALLDPNSDEPILNFPKINGRIFCSSSDGNGGFYVCGSYYRESENPSQDHNRIEHILADYTFEVNFSITTNGNIRNILYHNGILYIGSYSNTSIGGQAVGRLCGIDVVTKTLVNWIPSITRTSGTYLEVNRIKAKGNSLYIIGDFQFVGGIAREDAVSIQIGTGTVRNWNPRPNWVNYYNYADLVFYNEKIIIGGGFNEGTFPNTEGHSCAIVDTLNGNTFNYIFQSGTLTPGHSYLHFQSWVYALAIKNGTLFTYSAKGSTGDTRVSAISLINSNSTVWTRHFNYWADCSQSKMEIIDNSIFVLGKYFEFIYTQTLINQSNTIEMNLNGAGVKLNLNTGSLENWFPEPVGEISNDIWAMSVSNNKLLINGSFTHLKGIERNGVYMYKTSNETILPFKLNFYNDSPIYSMKLDGNNLYLGGDLSYQSNHDYSILAFNVNSGNILNWYPSKLGSGYIDAIEVNNQYVFVGGYSLTEPSGGLGRINLFAIDKSTGSFNSWSPNPNFQVRTLNLSYNQLYVGGDFTNIAGQNRNRVASFDISNLSLTNWNPNAGGRVNSIHPKSGNIWLGGDFSSVNNNTSRLIAGVNPSTGVNVINSNTILYGSPIRTLSSKGCKLFVGGDFQADNTGVCNNLFLFDLNTNSFVPTNNFCLTLDNYSYSTYVKTTSIIGDDLFFAGTFTKINNDTKNTNIGRIRFPINYFNNCNITNCGSEVGLISTTDDLSTGIYSQKTNLKISATNKILGNAQVTLKSNSSILLLPNTSTTTGFISKPIIGGSFKAEISPCN